MPKRYKTAGLRIIAASALAMLPLQAQAGTVTKNTLSSEELAEGAKMCTRHLSRYEREYGIPTHLLSAIATTESGRYHNGLKIMVPWPWTINAEGKAYFLKNKAEAVATAKKLRSMGVKSMDVGCMQVNLYHHPNAFTSLDDAFDPESNIAYAAIFLRALYEDDKNWKGAAADYHSKTPSLGKEYVSRVYSSWYQIIEKLREARMQLPQAAGVTQVAQAETQAQPVSAVVAATDKALSAPAGKVVKAPVKLAQLPEQQGRKVASYQAPRMNSIKVTRTAQREVSRDNGIIIVRPQIKVAQDDSAAVKTVAMNSLTPSAGEITLAQAKVATPDAKVIHVGSPAPVHKSGPTFIFND